MSYYDDLSKMFLKNSYRVSQYPGTPAPETRKYYKQHRGVDYATPQGTPIYAPFDANLAYSGQQNAYGNRVGITNPTTGQSYFFSHLSQIPQLSQQIKAGSIIGYTGNTGWSTGPHLDIETYGGGQMPRMTSNQPSQTYNRDTIVNAIKRKLGGQKILAIASDPRRLAGMRGKVVKVTI